MKNRLHSLLLRWQKLPRWARITSVSVAGFAVVPVVAASMIWSHYAREASSRDMAPLYRDVNEIRVVDAQGQYVGNAAEMDCKPVKLADVSPLLVQAVIATEDTRFYSHHGFDSVGLMRAALANMKAGGIKQGGSTITQQLARNAFGLEGRSYKRKVREIFLARRVEEVCSKERILELYLNRIYLGSSFYGVGSASRGYFGKDASALDLNEAATLAAIIKAPTSYSPFTRPEVAKQKRNLTLQRMADTGAISRELAAATMQQPLQTLNAGLRRRPTGYVLASVRDEYNGGKRVPDADGNVRTTMRVDWQRQMEETMRKHLQRMDESFASDSTAAQPLQGAAVVLDNRSGAILAMVGGRDFVSSEFNRALDGRRPAGTAFLPLVHAAALTVKPELLRAPLLDGPMDNREVMVGGRSGTLGEWGGENNDVVYQGTVSPLFALQTGRTAATVRLGYAAGLEPVRTSLAQSGIHSPLRNTAALTLGQSYVRPVEMAQAFTVLANGGMSCATPHVLAGTQGKFSYSFSANAATVVRNTMVKRLERPEYQAVLQAAGLAGQGIAGYGGTAYGFTDAWFAGFDQNITCIVWVGHDKDASMGPQAWALTTAFPLWADIFKTVTAGKIQGWPDSPKSAHFCALSGRLMPSRCQDHKDGACLISAAGTDLAELKKSFAPRAVAVADDQPSTAAIKPVSRVVLGDDVYQKTLNRRSTKPGSSRLASVGQ